MKKGLRILIPGILLAGSMMGQNVGIGTSTPSQKLHVSDATTPLSATVRVSGLSNGSTIPAGTAPFSVVMVDANGVMFRGGSTGAPNNAWLTLGNAGTNPATNFMGSTDNVSVVFRTNNLEVMRMTNAQKFLVGATTPSAPGTQKMEVLAAAGDAFWAHSPNVGAWVGYETNFSFGVPAQFINGAGIYASNPAAGYTSIYGQSTGAATVAAGILYSDVWMASYNYTQNGSATINPSANYNQLNVTNATLGGTQIALRGYNDRGTTAGNPGYTVGVQGLANSQNQDAIGVEGISFSSSGSISAGGYFEGLNYAGTSYAYAYVGGTTTGGATLRKIIGTGTVSEIVPTPSFGRVTLTCPESPEYYYVDYGTAEMVNGNVHVNIDPILTEICMIDAQNPVRVFCTPVGMPNFNGVTIMNQTATGFDILELNGGNHSGTIHYQLQLKPKTNYGEGRFPQAPGPSWLKPEMEPSSAKTQNQPTNVFHWPADYIQYGYDPTALTPPGNIIMAGPDAGKFKNYDGQLLDHVPANFKPQQK